MEDFAKRMLARKIRESLKFKIDSINFDSDMIDNCQDEVFKKAIQAVIDQQKMCFGKLQRILFTLDPKECELNKSGSNDISNIVNSVYKQQDKDDVNNLSIADLNIKTEPVPAEVVIATDDDESDYSFESIQEKLNEELEQTKNEYITSTKKTK
jgi:rubrerythrin